MHYETSFVHFEQAISSLYLGRIDRIQQRDQPRFEMISSDTALVQIVHDVLEQ